MKPLTPKFPHFIHGADYNPDQWLSYPGILEKDIELLKKANMNSVSVGIFSWAKLEPQEGVFDLDWLAEIIDNLYKNGIYTILATPSGAKPHWMSQKYEEICRVSSNMTRELPGVRQNHCLTSPIYREKVKIINTLLAERFADHPGVILWHLSNEYSGKCFCPLCQEAFRDWLKAKYQTLNALNEAWWTAFWSHTYTDWSQIQAPVPSGETCTHGLDLDWNRFSTDQAVDFMRCEIESLRTVNADMPVTTNLMYDYYEYNYNKFAPHIDVVSWDSYPWWHNPNNRQVAMEHAFWHDYMRSLKKLPFLLMESTPSATNWQPISKLKRPNMHITSGLQAVAHGSNSVQYFQFRKSRGSSEKFHGAVVDHNGEGNTRVFAEISALGEKLISLDSIYNSMPKPQVAIVYDTENRWAIEGAAGPRNVGIHYMETLHEHYKYFWENGIPVDVIDEECDLSDYKVVIAPMLYMLRKGFDEKLRAFTKSGGTLVSTYHSGIVDENDLCYLGGWPGGMMDIFGIWNEETDSLYDGETNSIHVENTNYDGDYTVSELCAIIHAKTADVLAVYGKDFYRDTPALTKNLFGEGNAYYIAAKPDEAFLSAFYDDIAEELQLKKALDANLPKDVYAVLREDETHDYVFLMNFSDMEQEAALPAGYVLFESGEAVRHVDLDGFCSVVLKKQK